MWFVTATFSRFLLSAWHAQGLQQCGVRIPHADSDMYLSRPKSPSLPATPILLPSSSFHKRGTYPANGFLIFLNPALTCWNLKGSQELGILAKGILERVRGGRLSVKKDIRLSARKRGLKHSWICQSISLSTCLSSLSSYLWKCFPFLK